MSANPSDPDVWIDLYLDGEFVRTVRLDAAAGAAEGPGGVGPAQCRRVVSVTLPARGGLHLAVDLRRPAADDAAGQAGPLAETAARLAGARYGHGGRITTYVYEGSGRPPRAAGGGSPPEPPEPPDEPHVTG